MKRQKTTEDEIYVLGLWFLGIGSIFMLVYFKFIVPVLPENSCFMWKVLGIYCPGCGGTRAVEALFHGRLLASVWYHPLVLYTLIGYGGFMLTQTLKRMHIPYIRGWRYHDWYLWTALGIVAGNWILKNVLLIGFGILL